MFSGGPAKKSSYQMDFVPLRIGVKIRPDENYYGKAAVDSYKDAS